jgi:hypothetical protein
VFQTFDNRLDILEARPNRKIASFDLAKDPVDSPRQFDTELGSL